MARVKITKLVDDLDGVSPADETIKFSYEGVDYEIQLSAKHAAEFRAVVAEWTPYARALGTVKSATRRTRRDPDAPRVDRAENLLIRTWAAKQGYVLPPRGRIRVDVRNAYFDAHM
jgi:hypothetical protein